MNDRPNDVLCTGPVKPVATITSPPKEPYRCCDLFAGAGGFSEGIEQAGFEVTVANELDEAAARTYALNHPHTKLIVGDITLKETKDAICACFADVPCDLLVGGVPCQSFSCASSRSRGMADRRGQLWFAYMEVLRRLKPRMAIAENVRGLLSHPDAVKAIDSTFKYLGYRVEHSVLNAADHGVPQVRERLFFVATRLDWRDLPIIWPQARFAATERNSKL